MSNLNWPEGATHYLDAGDENTRFRDLSGEKWKFFNALTGKWVQHYFSSEYLLASHDLIPRPQPKPWSGPEDGLPPVGITCERRFPSVTASSWQGGIILAHGSKKIFFRDNCGDEWSHSFDDVEFRAFRTTAQIAAEKRETAILEIMDVADVDCRVTAARLVDAGFKREVV